MNGFRRVERHFLGGVYKLEKKGAIKGSKTEIAISSICKYTRNIHIYSSSNIAFETFNLRGCSSKNIFTARLYSIWTPR